MLLILKKNTIDIGTQCTYIHRKFFYVAKLGTIIRKDGTHEIPHCRLKRYQMNAREVFFRLIAELKAPL